MKTFSEIKIYPLRKPAGKLVANGSVMVAGCVKVNFKVMDGSKGIFASFPSRKSNKVDDNGKPVWYNEVFITDETKRDEFQTLVKKEYQLTVGASGQEIAGEEYQDDVPF